MSSKGQGLSLNTIIIAAIVLIVLFLLVGLTTGYFSKWKVNFSSASDTCQGNGGKVVEKGKACETYFTPSSKSYPDIIKDEQCCMPTCSGFGDCQSKCRDWERDTGTRDCSAGQTCCRAKSLP